MRFFCIKNDLPILFVLIVLQTVNAVKSKTSNGSCSKMTRTIHSHKTATLFTCDIPEMQAAVVNMIISYCTFDVANDNLSSTPFISFTAAISNSSKQRLQRKAIEVNLNFGVKYVERAKFYENSDYCRILKNS